MSTRPLQDVKMPPFGSVRAGASPPGASARATPLQDLLRVFWGSFVERLLGCQLLNTPGVVSIAPVYVYIMDYVFRAVCVCLGKYFAFFAHTLNAFSTSNSCPSVYLPPLSYNSNLPPAFPPLRHSHTSPRPTDTPCSEPTLEPPGVRRPPQTRKSPRS